MQMYDLIPKNGRKSFYGRAKVMIDDDGTETLLSYNTPIVKRGKDGNLVKLYQNEPTVTTLTHIKNFCGLNKEQFIALP